MQGWYLLFTSPGNMQQLQRYNSQTARPLDSIRQAPNLGCEREAASSACIQSLFSGCLHLYRLAVSCTSRLWNISTTQHLLKVSCLLEFQQTRSPCIHPRPIFMLIGIGRAQGQKSTDPIRWNEIAAACSLEQNHNHVVSFKQMSP